MADFYDEVQGALIRLTLPDWNDDMLHIINHLDEDERDEMRAQLAAIEDAIERFHDLWSECYSR